MSDDRLADDLNGYAAHVQTTGRLPTSTEIRHLARRRRQRSAATATFGLVLVGTLGIGIAATRPGPVPAAPTTTAPATPAVSAGPSGATPSVGPSTPQAPPATPRPTGTMPAPTPSGRRLYPSNVSELEQLGIDLNTGVLIDVADDGLNRYLEISPNGTLDFTGTSKTDNTMMALTPAQVTKRNTKNRVVIAPPLYNEDLGPGYCVADTAPGVLKLATCVPGASAQTWHVIPAGDSGQFELHGAKTTIRVDNGRITTNGQGYVGLQTITFAG